ncbi:hypothetical protein ACO03V_06010 [Microbacterium sp. HMH0099]|uniref:hypothetical protein n=1 Tax=Microbacterium sp. HMH0099 TaxID=3414026 RepID=UPI003BF72A44
MPDNSSVFDPDALATSFGEWVSNFPDTPLFVTDPIVEHAATKWGLSSVAAREVLLNELSKILKGPELESAHLLAAGWLLNMRERSIAQIHRDTNGALYSGQEEKLVEQLAKGNKGASRTVAYYVLKARTQRWAGKNLRHPHTAFLYKQGERLTPRAQEVADSLLVALLAAIDQHAESRTKSVSTSSGDDPKPRASNSALSDHASPPGELRTSDSRSVDEVDSAAPAASESPISFNWRPLTRWVAPALTVTAVLTSGYVAYVGAMNSPGSQIALQPGATSTSIHTFIPGAEYAQRFAETPQDQSISTCWSRSYVSARRDARLCAYGGSSGGIVRDPCFTYRDQGVVCVDPRDVYDPAESTPGVVAREPNIVDGPAYLKGGEIVGAEQADQTEYPWSMKIRVGAIPVDYICVPLLSPNASFSRVTFTCEAGGPDRPIVSIGDDEFRSGRWLVVSPPGAVHATALDRSAPTWTVEVADPGTNTLTTAPVLEAWF